MSASFLSSFFVFILTGLLLLWEITFNAPLISQITLIETDSWFDENATHPLLRFALAAAIFACALSFYFFASLCEMDQEFSERLGLCSRLEWVVRVANQTAFMGLWIILPSSMGIFTCYFILLYLSFLLWDWLTRKQFPKEVQEGSEEEKMKNSKNRLLDADIKGLVLAIVLLLVLWKWPEAWDEQGKALTLMVIAVLMGVLSYGAVKKAGEENDFSWKPWKGDLWTRDRLK